MGTSTIPPKVNLDYTEHAAHYDKRADYSAEAIKNLLKAIDCDPSKPAADIGAGTGKLTKELLKHGLSVRSVEPNDAMRAIGIQNTKGKSASRSVGTGEATGLPANGVYAVFSGSSFNAVDQQLPYPRILESFSLTAGLFACGIIEI
jgi:SAM-dependent methyltransferase